MISNLTRCNVTPRDVRSFQRRFPLDPDPDDQCSFCMKMQSDVLSSLPIQFCQPPLDDGEDEEVVAAAAAVVVVVVASRIMSMRFSLNSG